VKRPRILFWYDLAETVSRAWDSFWYPFVFVWQECPHVCGMVLGAALATAVWWGFFWIIFYRYVGATT